MGHVHEDIWSIFKKKFMQGFKSAILTIFLEIGRLAGLVQPSISTHRTYLPIKYEPKTPSVEMAYVLGIQNEIEAL